MDAKNQSLHKKTLPRKMVQAAALIDPYNDKNCYIFGSRGNNQCWYLNNQNKPTFIKIDDITEIRKGFEIQIMVEKHACALFETPKSKNKYSFIYGEYRNIFDFQNERWIESDFEFKFDDHSFYTRYDFEFGRGFSMITDLFEKNKIHIVGGEESKRNYGYFEFTEGMIKNSESPDAS